MPSEVFNTAPMPASFVMPSQLNDLRMNNGLLVVIEVSQGDADREIGFVFELTQAMIGTYIRESQYLKSERCVLSLCMAITTANCYWIYPEKCTPEVILYRPVIELFANGDVGLNDFMPCSQMLSTRTPLSIWEQSLHSGNHLSIFQPFESPLSGLIAEGHYQLVSPR